MWNKLAELIRDPSFKRLGIAIIISAILHTVFFGRFDFKLPFFVDKTPPIEARIQIAKAVTPTLEQLKQAAEILKPKPIKPTKPTETPPIEIPKEEITEQEKITEAPAGTTPEIEPVTEQVAAQQSAENQPIEETTEGPPASPNFVLNENAYQYVETEFEVRTEVDGSVQGSAKITHEVIDGHLYNLNFVVQPKGLVALFVSNLVQTSKGKLTSTGLQPNTYTYLYGDKAEKTRTANFDWVNKKLESITAKGSKMDELLEDTQDLLSFMYHFMYVPPLEKMQINIANGKKLTIYDYSFEGEESVILPNGEFRTIHIVHTGNNVDEKTELWLAIDYQHIPIKIVKTEKEGRYYEFVATRISTTRPTTQ